MKPTVPQISNSTTATNPNASTWSRWTSYGIDLGMSAAQVVYNAYSALPSLSQSTVDTPLNDRSVNTSIDTFKEDLYNKIDTMSPKEAFFFIHDELLKIDLFYEMFWIARDGKRDDGTEVNLTSIKKEVNESTTQILILLNAIDHLIERHHNDQAFLKLVPIIIQMCSYNPIIYVQKILSLCEPHFADGISDFTRNSANITINKILFFLKDYLSSNNHLTLLSELYEEKAISLTSEARRHESFNETREASDKLRKAAHRLQTITDIQDSLLFLLSVSDKRSPGRKGMAELLLWLIKNSKTSTSYSMHVKMESLHAFIADRCSTIPDLAGSNLKDHANEVFLALFETDSNKNNPDFLTIILKKDLEGAANPIFFRQALENVVKKELADMPNKTHPDAIESFHSLFRLLSAASKKTSDQMLIDLNNQLIRISAEVFLTYIEKDFSWLELKAIQDLAGPICNIINSLLFKIENPLPEIDAVYNLKLGINTRLAAILVNYTDSQIFKNLESKELYSFLRLLEDTRSAIHELSFHTYKHPMGGFPRNEYSDNPNQAIITSTRRSISECIDKIKKMPLLKAFLDDREEQRKKRIEAILLKLRTS